MSMFMSPSIGEVMNTINWGTRSIQTTWAKWFIPDESPQIGNCWSDQTSCRRHNFQKQIECNVLWSTSVYKNISATAADMSDSCPWTQLSKKGIEFTIVWVLKTTSWSLTTSTEVLQRHACYGLPSTSTAAPLQTEWSIANVLEGGASDNNVELKKSIPIENNLINYGLV